MDHRIVKRDGFRVIGKVMQVSTKDAEDERQIPEFWNECNLNGTCAKLCSMTENKDLLGICMDMDHQKESFTYMIAVEDTNNTKESDFVPREIPAATWAIFPLIGPVDEGIRDLWERIFREWFPASGYVHGKAPQLEVYPPGNPNSEDYRCEIWIPIVEK